MFPKLRKSTYNQIIARSRHYAGINLIFIKKNYLLFVVQSTKDDGDRDSYLDNIDVFYDAEEKFSDSEFEASVRIDDSDDELLEENSSEDDQQQNGDVKTGDNKHNETNGGELTVKKTSDIKLTPRSQRKQPRYRYVT